MRYHTFEELFDKGERDNVAAFVGRDGPCYAWCEDGERLYCSRMQIAEFIRKFDLPWAASIREGDYYMKPITRE